MEKLDANKIINDFDYERINKKGKAEGFVKQIVEVLKQYNEGINTVGYTENDINDLKKVLKELYKFLIDYKKQEINSLNSINKIQQIRSFTEDILYDIDKNKEINIYTAEEIDNLKALIKELHELYEETIKNSIAYAKTDSEKYKNAFIANANLEEIINNPKEFTEEEIDKLKQLNNTLSNYLTNYKKTATSTEKTQEKLPDNLFENLESIEKNFSECIFNRDLKGIIDNDAKFKEEVYKVKKSYMTNSLVVDKLTKYQKDHEFYFAFFSNNIKNGTDTKLLLDNVEMTVRSIMELLGKEKKSSKDYADLKTLTDEFNEKYVSCKSYILSNNDVNSQFYLARLESYKSQCDSSKKELVKQEKHSKIDKRRIAFKFIGTPLNLPIKLFMESFTTAFPELKGINDRMSKFNLNDYAFKNLKFLKYEEDYTNLQKGHAYWKSYKDLSKMEQIDKFMVDFDVINKSFGTLKRLFDFTHNYSYGVVNNMVGGKKR
jgi:hypothetical protein